MFRYRAMTVNCGNETLGTRASGKIAALLKTPLDFCVINCQEVHFDKAKKELEQALNKSGLEGYSVILVGKMTTPTKVDSRKDIQNALLGNTGMASFIIHKDDINIHVDSVEEARRNPWAIGTAFNKGGLVSRCTMTKASDPSEVINLELVSGHLDSNKIAERAQDWGVIQKKLTPSSKQITDFKALSEAIPHLRLSGYDANTRNKIVHGKAVSLWVVDTEDISDAFELEGLKQRVLGDARYSADSTYKTEDKTSATARSPVKKRQGYAKGGMLDFVDILDGTNKHDPNGIITIDSGDDSTKRDHAVVISPEQIYTTTTTAFDHTRDQMAAMLLQAAPMLAEDLRALKPSPENEKKLLDIYHIFLSREGLLTQAFDIFQEKLQVIQRVNKQAPQDKNKVQDQLFPAKQTGPWFQSVSLDNYISKVESIHRQQEEIKNKIKAIAAHYSNPSRFSAIKTKLFDTKSKELESVAKPLETLIEAEIWSLEQVSWFYTQEYSKNTWYQPPQKTDEGNIRVPFPDSKTALEFGEAMAKKEVSLMIVDDATGNVLAYSYGDGILNTNKEQRTLDDIRSDILAHKNPSSSGP